MSDSESFDNCIFDDTTARRFTSNVGAPGMELSNNVIKEVVRIKIFATHTLTDLAAIEKVLDWLRRTRESTSVPERADDSFVANAKLFCDDIRGKGEAIVLQVAVALSQDTAQRSVYSALVEINQRHMQAHAVALQMHYTAAKQTSTWPETERLLLRIRLRAECNFHRAEGCRPEDLKSIELALSQ